MPAIILYLIRFSCSLAVSWLFYRLVLRNLTFYTLNRWYLLGYSLLSFLIPWINIGPIDSEDPTLQPLIVQYIPVIDKPAAMRALHVNNSFQWDPWHAVLLLTAIGSFSLLVRFLIRYHSLRRIKRQAILLQDGLVRIFRVEQPISPFSFGNAIYVNAGRHTAKEWEEIILHEYVHIRGRHTLDILLAELLVITNWFNPFAWLIRHSIRQNLEFIADCAVVENGVDKKGYQYHLLRVVGQNRYRLANNFNFSSLKKRLIMMNKIRSARLHLLRFLFILPLLGALLVAFRDRTPHLHPANQPAIRLHMANVADTVKPGRIAVIGSPHTTLDPRKALYIIDGVIKGECTPDDIHINPSDIASMTVLKGKKATDLFGKRGANGVVAIITKKNRPDHDAQVDGPPSAALQPLYVIDGIPHKDGLKDLKPDDIASIDVLGTTENYGEKGRSGVVIVTTKKTQPHPRVVLQTIDSAGRPMTIIADSLSIPRGSIHAENIKPD